MVKYNVVLDTNIYRKNPSRSDLPFQALERLCRSNVVKLHLPYIVEREFQTQQCAIYRKDLETAASSINAVLRRGMSSNLATRVKSLRDEIIASTQPVLDDVEADIVTWATSVNATRHPITEPQARSAMESYFNGHPPLSVPKARDDIPDAFIFQTILSIYSDDTPLVVVAEDGKIASASEALPSVTVYRSLSSFIESESIQAEMLDLDVIENLPAIAEELQKYETEQGQISHHVASHGGGKLVWKKIYSSSIPDDNNEAIITGYYDPEDVELDFTELYYFGTGEFGLPFKFNARVSGTYYIFKSDYYCLDERHMPSVSDHNDHYFEAEDEFDVTVSGFLRLSVDLPYLNTISAESVDEHLTCDIDSIDEIELVE